MGFVWLALAGALAMAGLVRLGLARPLWSFAGAALMLGATGYALQGRPLLGGRPAGGAASPDLLDPAAANLRAEMFGRFTGDGAYLVAADAMMRSGDAGAAAAWCLAGIRKVPDSALLWTGLGDALVAHDGRQLSPAARFAYARAARLAPTHPGPLFFRGIAEVRAGNFAAARPLWARALALAPADAPYRGAIAERLALLDRYLAAVAASDAPPPAPARP
jgi:cytochrome c-type biogenesis protein CcmH